MTSRKGVGMRLVACTGGRQQGPKIVWKASWSGACGLKSNSGWDAGEVGEKLEDEEGPDSGKGPQPMDCAVPLCLLSVCRSACLFPTLCKARKGGETWPESLHVSEKWEGTGQAWGWGAQLGQHLRAPLPIPPPDIIYTLPTTLKDGTRWQGLSLNGWLSVQEEWWGKG